MHGFLRFALIPICICALWSNAAAQDMNDKASQTALDIMRQAYTSGHPDEEGEIDGMLAYAHGDYATAMAQFKSAASYADKYSQLNIGLMYLNGDGVTKDPVEAFAWVAIAAERKYPQFLATRDRIWSELDASQRERAKARIDVLYADYGDTTAKPRMERALRMGLADMTGTSLGYAAGSPVFTALPGRGAAVTCGKASDYVLVVGCGNIYARKRWKPVDYFQMRDDAWSSTVTVGALQKLPGSTDSNTAH